MKRISIIAWCWLWYLLAQAGDMVTSLARWGGEELNPYFRNELHIFQWSHALVGKAAMTFVIGSVSLFLYKLVEPLDKRVATLLACLLPLWVGYQVWQVVNSNFFMIMRWVNP